MISQHWFRWWLGAIRQQAITWTNVDTDPCRHMVSLGHNELRLLPHLPGANKLTSPALSNPVFTEWTYFPVETKSFSSRPSSSTCASVGASPVDCTLTNHHTLKEIAREWASLKAFLGTEDIGVHVVHTSHVIIAYTLESLSSLDR